MVEINKFYNDGIVSCAICQGIFKHEMHKNSNECKSSESKDAITLGIWQAIYQGQIDFINVNLQHEKEKNVSGWSKEMFYICIMYVMQILLLLNSDVGRGYGHVMVCTAHEAKYSKLFIGYIDYMFMDGKENKRNKSSQHPHKSNTVVYHPHQDFFEFYRRPP